MRDAKTRAAANELRAAELRAERLIREAERIPTLSERELDELRWFGATRRQREDRESNLRLVERLDGIMREAEQNQSRASGRAAAANDDEEAADERHG